MLSLLFVLLVASVVTGVGWTVVTRLDGDSRFTEGERLLLSFAVGCYGVYFGVLAIGTYRLDALSMWGFLAVLFVAALPGLWRMPWGAFADCMRREFAEARTHPSTGLLWLTLIGVGLSSLLQGLAPPNDYDSLMYHMALPQYDVELGRLGIPWDRHLPHALFPAMASNLTRLSLAVMDSGAAQLLHGLFGLVAASGAAVLARRMGLAKQVALIAAIFFLAIRVVVWEMGTVEVDVPLAAFAALATLVYLVWRQGGQTGHGILFGLMVAGGILVKYYGFPLALSFAPLVFFDLVRRRMSTIRMAIGPVVALVAITPHLIRNYSITSNPIFPLFNSFFNPGHSDMFNAASTAFGTGRGLDDLFAAPWNIFVFPMHYFDGMIFGAPYLLALCPLLLLDREASRRWLPIVTIAVFYFILWFYIGAQQVRFLLPIMPFLAATAAGGASAMWARTAEKPVLRTTFVAIVAAMGLNQMMFVGIYAALRLPVAAGLMTDTTYHAQTPTMNSAFYNTCGFIRENLKQGERYFSLINPLSYYCPQVPVTHVSFEDEATWWLTSKSPPEMRLEEFVRRLEQGNYKYFIVPTADENRRNVTATPIIKTTDYTMIRFGRHLKPVIDTLRPLAKGPYTAVYDGAEILTLLKSAKNG